MRVSKYIITLWLRREWEGVGEKEREIKRVREGVSERKRERESDRVRENRKRNFR